jgi:hypothetical protein
VLWQKIIKYLIVHTFKYSIGYNGYMADDAKPWDLINGSPRAPEDIAAERLAICKGCEFFRKGNQSCKKCGCFMKLKTLIDKAKCPIDKW